MAVHDPDRPDLITQLTLAATQAISGEKRSLEYDERRIRGVVLELELVGGAVVGRSIYVERQPKSIRGSAVRSDQSRGARS